MVPPGLYLADIGLERSTQGRFYVPVDQADRFDHLCLRHRQIFEGVQRRLEAALQAFLYIFSREGAGIFAQNGR
jgi:hypothetical protein